MLQRIEQADAFFKSVGADVRQALRTTTDRLTELILRTLEDLLAIATTPFDHIGVVSLMDRQI